MKQKKTLRFSDSDSSASALQDPEKKQSSQIVTVGNETKTTTAHTARKEETMNTDTNTTTATTTRKTAKTSKKVEEVKAHTLATCKECAKEYKAEKWHTESLCPTCYTKAHPKPEKAEATAGQTIARAVAGVALAVLITKGTHYAVSVVNPTTGENVSKVYVLKSHGEALTLAEKMYNDRKLQDILDATAEGKASEAKIDTEATIAGE
jgi:predicted Zn-ribbon and HTH transcriptional regulator